MSPANQSFVFILGGSNDDNGTLSDISLSRVDGAIALFGGDRGVAFLATGGFSDHFNRTDRSHRAWVEDELLQRGFEPARSASDELLSANTVEDALLIATFARRRKLTDFDVVTSEFHVQRCEFVFDCLLHDFSFRIHGSNSFVSRLPDRIAHEFAALERMKSQGGVILDGQLHRPHGSH